MAQIDPTDLVKNFEEYSGGDGLWGAVRSGLGGFVVAFFFAFIAMVNAGQALFTDPLGALASGSADVVTGLVGGTARILNQAATTAVQSLAPGATWAAGPLTFLFGILLMGGAMYLFAQLMQMPATSDILPFTLSDLPLVGAEEEDG